MLQNYSFILQIQSVSSGIHNCIYVVHFDSLCFPVWSKRCTFHRLGKSIQNVYYVPSL